MTGGRVLDVRHDSGVVGLFDIALQFRAIPYERRTHPHVALYFVADRDFHFAQAILARLAKEQAAKQVKPKRRRHKVTERLGRWGID